MFLDTPTRVQSDTFNQCAPNVVSYVPSYVSVTLRAKWQLVTNSIRFNGTNIYSNVIQFTIRVPQLY